MLAHTFLNIWLGGKSDFPYCLLIFINVTRENPQPKAKLKLTAGNPVLKAFTALSLTCPEGVTFPGVPASASLTLLGRQEGPASNQKARGLQVMLYKRHILKIFATHASQRLT